MKRLTYLALFILSVALYSCDELGDLVPDIDKVVTESYQVTIDANVPTGVTDTIFIDVQEYPEYQDYKQYVSGYKVNKIGYLLEDYNAPEDLFFTGSIIATDSANVTEIVVGTVPSLSLFDLSTMVEEGEMVLDTVAVNQLINWIEDPGNFNIKFQFKFENSDGSDYNFVEEDFGSTFTMKVKLYLTIVT
jgi:hypothetical protein